MGGTIEGLNNGEKLSTKKEKTKVDDKDDRDDKDDKETKVDAPDNPQNTLSKIQITPPIQLTRNFDKLTSKIIEIEKETKEPDEFSFHIEESLPKIPTKTCMTIKNYILGIFKQVKQEFSEKDLSVASSPKNDKVLIRISGKLTDESLSNLVNILGDSAQKDLITTFTIDAKNLSKVMEMLKQKSPKPVKAKGTGLKKAKADKLEDNLETKDR